MFSLSKPKVTELLCELIRIPSINPHLAVEKDHNEMALALFICDWLHAHNIKAQIEEVLPGRPNVYAEIGNGNGPTLCLCAHLDTVGVQEMTIPPFQPAIDNNRVYGRGSCDMKGGLAAVISAALAIAEQGICGKLILALVCDEEYASIGADDFVKRHQAAGIPTVNIGPIGFGLHEPVEWVDLDSVVKTAEVLFHAANAFLQSPACSFSKQAGYL